MSARSAGTSAHFRRGWTVTFDEPIDLGIVFKGHTILTVIDRLLSAAGFHRIPAPPDETQPAESESLTEADRELGEATEGRRERPPATGNERPQVRQSCRCLLRRPQQTQGR
jgi:hypothetical protein